MMTRHFPTRIYASSAKIKDCFGTIKWRRRFSCSTMATSEETERATKADTTTDDPENDQDLQLGTTKPADDNDDDKSSRVREVSMIENFTHGFTSELLPQLQELREKTKELTKNQTVLIETMQQENRKFSENKEIEEFTKMISVVQSYYAKLKNIKSEMDQLDDKLVKLKRRSLKLKEKRNKRDSDEVQKRERELALERELTAKPAT